MRFHRCRKSDHQVAFALVEVSDQDVSVQGSVVHLPLLRGFRPAVYRSVLDLFPLHALDPGLRTGNPKIRGLIRHFRFFLNLLDRFVEYSLFDHIDVHRLTRDLVGLFCRRRDHEWPSPE